MSVDSLLEGTPTWFKRLVIPMVFTVLIAVPATLAFSDSKSRLTDVEQRIIQLAGEIENELIELKELIDELSRRGETTSDTVQRYEVQQAVMVNQMSNMDEKLDRLIQAIEGRN